MHVRHSGGLPGFGIEWGFLPQHSGRVGIVSMGKSSCGMALVNNVAMDLLLAKGIVSRTGSESEEELQPAAYGDFGA